MNIGLLGGAFNPPHNGHIAIAQQVLDFTDCDEVWFVPAYRHTFVKPMAAVEDRVEMTKLLAESSHVSRLTYHVSTLEIDNQLDGNTINLLPFLSHDHSYRFIIGSDNLPTFHLWGDWQRLLKEIPFLVFPRYGYPNEPLYENMTMINDESLIVSNLSSTKIRDRVHRGLSIESFVPAKVGEYIREHGLYK
jgi:nicotinate-nucleotide adenylyltransferase